MNEYPYVLSPYTIRGKVFKNRILAAPVGPPQFVMGSVAPYAIDMIKRKAGAGIAEFTIAESPVSCEGSRGGEGNIDYKSPESLASLKTLSNVIHECGALASMQFSHAGGARIVAKPDVPIKGAMDRVHPNGAVVHAMTEADIDNVCEDYATAAEALVMAGFDGIMPHFAHGWLFSEFLSPLTNRRTDRFGGSLENRARISVMVLQRIRERVGDSLYIECRVSGSDYVDGSYTLDDMCQYCKLLSEYADIIHVSAGIYRDGMRTHMMTTSYDPHNFNLETAAAIKKAVDIPIAVVGGINNPDDIENMIASGKVDFAVLGRELMSEPEFVNKLLDGGADEINRCMRCMRCFPGEMEEIIAEGYEYPPGCTMNPQEKNVGMDSNMPAPVKKRVLVVGGGPAGMQAAVTAAERGHKVLLIEKSNTLGGLLNLERDNPDKIDMAAFADTLGVKVHNRGVDVRLNTQLTNEMVEQFDPDTIIAAVGSEPTKSAIPGLEDFGISAADTEAMTSIRSNDIVILGGGVIGCEAAVFMKKLGKTVKLISRSGHLAKDAYRLHRIRLKDMMKEIEIISNVTPIKVTRQGVIVVESGRRERVISGEAVIYALGMAPVSTAPIRQLSQGRNFVEIGDCSSKGHGRIFDAIDAGFLAAMSL